MILKRKTQGSPAVNLNSYPEERGEEREERKHTLFVSSYASESLRECAEALDESIEV